MYSDAMPEAARAPTTDPADVPTMYSASAARHPVSDSSASTAPISQDAPRTPPAPRTRPTRMTASVPASTDCQSAHLGPARGEKTPPTAGKTRSYADKERGKARLN